MTIHLETIWNHDGAGKKNDLWLVSKISNCSVPLVIWLKFECMAALSHLWPKRHFKFPIHISLPSMLCWCPALGPAIIAEHHHHLSPSADQVCEAAGCIKSFLSKSLTAFSQGFEAFQTLTRRPYTTCARLHTIGKMSQMVSEKRPGTASSWAHFISRMKKANSVDMAMCISEFRPAKMIGWSNLYQQKSIPMFYLLFQIQFVRKKKAQVRIAT